MGGPGYNIWEKNTNYVAVYKPREELGADTFRRMVYQFKPRSQADPTFGAFDCPDAALVAPRRNVSTTALQALNLLNSRFVVQQAAYFAERLTNDAGPDPARQAERGLRLAFGRMPSGSERTAAVAPDPVSRLRGVLPGAVQCQRVRLRSVRAAIGWKEGRDGIRHLGSSFSAKMSIPRMSMTLLLGLVVLVAGERACAAGGRNTGPLRYTISWVGNTFGGGPRWVQNAADSMQVLPDGTLVVGSFWDEGGREVGLYKDGDIVGRLPDTHMRAGFAVAANDRYVFYAHTCGLENQPQAKAGEVLSEKPICYFGVSRYTRDGKHAPFSGGKTRFKNMLALREAPDNHALIPRGVAATDKGLFVADTAFDTIRVIDPGTMKGVREFPAPTPGRLAVDAAGNLWVICEGGKRVASYSADGKLRLEALPLPADSVPSGLGFDHAGRLLVCDNGPRQQVHAFDVNQAPPRLAASFGEEGGMFAGPEPGKAGPARFAGPTGAGCDATGNLYVSCNVPRGGTVLRAFSPRRKLLWELLGLEFVDVADADPASDGRDVFTADDRYRFDPDAPPGKGWRWEAHTLDPHRYPHDLRLRFPVLQCGTSVRTLGSKRFLCQRGMWQGFLGIYRIDGDLAVPSAVLSSGPIKTDEGWSPPGQPAAGRWLWRDADADGQMEAGEYVPTTGPDGEYWASNVDASGDIWQAGRESGIWRWRFQGLDAHRNPRYDPKPEHYPMPAPFTDLLRTEYVTKTDTMYLSGQAKDRPISNGEWGTAGTVIVRYDDWTKTRKLRYRIDLPYIGDKQFIVSIAYAGELAFAVDCKSAEVFVYSLRDGSTLGSMTPGPEVHGESGWVDIRDGIRAMRRKDGGYLVFVEEDYKGKSLVYRLEDPLEAAN